MLKILKLSTGIALIGLTAHGHSNKKSAVPKGNEMSTDSMEETVVAQEKLQTERPQ